MAWSVITVTFRLVAAGAGVAGLVAAGAVLATAPSAFERGRALLAVVVDVAGGAAATGAAQGAAGGGAGGGLGELAGFPAGGLVPGGLGEPGEVGGVPLPPAGGAVAAGADVQLVFGQGVGAGVAQQGGAVAGAGDRVIPAESTLGSLQVLLDQLRHRLVATEILDADQHHG